jgi:hypothetical protein
MTAERPSPKGARRRAAKADGRGQALPAAPDTAGRERTAADQREGRERSAIFSVLLESSTQPFAVVYPDGRWACATRPT